MNLADCSDCGEFRGHGHVCARFISLEDLAVLVDEVSYRVSKPVLRVASRKHVELWCGTEQHPKAIGRADILEWLLGELASEAEIVSKCLKTNAEEAARLQGKQARIEGFLTRFARKAE